MTDLDTIDESLLIARGKYSTIRSEHEDAKKALQILCGELQSHSARILKHMQPDNDSVPDSVDAIFKAARITLDEMEVLVADMEQLAKQRSTLRPVAWPKK